jgi:tRNA A37 methylthiotransferase MiaB
MDLKDKSFFLRTFGCQMNESDSEKIAGILTAAGGREAERVEDADIIIVNTCAVREKSEEKLYSYLGRIRPRPGARPVLVGVAGCVAFHRLRGRSRQLFETPGDHRTVRRADDHRRRMVE